MFGSFIGSSSILTRFLSHPINNTQEVHPKRTNEFKEDPILAACRIGNVPWFLEEIKLCPNKINREFRSGKTGKYISLLYIASQKGHKKIVQLLIENGADVNKATDVGKTPLYSACREGYTEIAELLITNGADINTFTEGETTPLYITCQNGYENIAKLLIKHGANINPLTDEKTTPLDIAYENGHTKTIALLIEHGGNLEECKNKEIERRIFTWKKNV